VHEECARLLHCRRQFCEGRPWAWIWPGLLGGGREGGRLELRNLGEWSDLRKEWPTINSFWTGKSLLRLPQLSQKSTFGPELQNRIKHIPQLWNRSYYVPRLIESGFKGGFVFFFFYLFQLNLWKS
jgi:hypothetical protein